MPIPDFQTIMLPLLKTLQDGSVHRYKDIKLMLVKEFNLSEDELKEMLPSGRAKLFDNRVGWSNTYLKKAGLVKSDQKGFLQITDEGKDLLKEIPPKITISFLKKYKTFDDFHSRKSQAKEKLINGNEEVIEKSPEEVIEEAFDELRADLAVDLLETIKGCSPSFFENIVVDLVLKMGYGGSKKDAGRAIGKSGDGGIDGIINEDKLGLDSIYIQAKRWENVVPIKEIRDFAGSLLSKKARKGIFITTSTFPQSAYDFVSSIDPRIILIDGNKLASYMIEHEVGVSTKVSYPIKEIDHDYFAED